VTSRQRSMAAAQPPADCAPAATSPACCSTSGLISRGEPVHQPVAQHSSWQCVRMPQPAQPAVLPAGRLASLSRHSRAAGSVCICRHQPSLLFCQPAGGRCMSQQHSTAASGIRTSPTCSVFGRRSHQCRQGVAQMVTMTCVWLPELDVVMQQWQPPADGQSSPVTAGGGQAQSRAAKRNSDAADDSAVSAANAAQYEEQRQLLCTYHQSL
jgi:hypothetical protein